MGNYDSVTVANYLLALAYKKGIVLNVTKVQKLLFIAYGYFLAKYNQHLLNEPPRAWPFGPVFPKTRKQVDYSKIIGVEDASLQEIAADPIVTDTLSRIIDRYSKFSASQLSDWSHMPGSPWDKTTKEASFTWDYPIPDEYIKEYFSGIEI
ncbi:hypothetical protein AHMF7605_19200 [Adhaeribacter arboris]|uniref:Antitoxin SocA-like Panacea domain-containing protein n=1 Tax=Adhaeribacter arboris TaxID=2072846 RepID=A0A2T2YJ00_9BACT|nr:type II toxin-antitoxin system antitoxin SocA domain-containing protein [Adhaeribacter arboris]PSR55481.1 hypothetical protein AHMF7605_19200 [Adhaeribacter arboris]